MARVVVESRPPLSNTTAFGPADIARPPLLPTLIRTQEQYHLIMGSAMARLLGMA